MTNVQCDGNEGTFTDCRHDDVMESEVSACQVNYAALACYNGTKTSGRGFKNLTHNFMVALSDKNHLMSHLLIAGCDSI